MLSPSTFPSNMKSVTDNSCRREPLPKGSSLQRNWFSCKDKISAVGRGWRKFVLPSNQASSPHLHPLLTARGPEHQEPLEPTGAKELFLSRGDCPGFISFVVTVFGGFFVCLFVHLFFFKFSIILEQREFFDIFILHQALQIR